MREPTFPTWGAVPLIRIVMYGALLGTGVLREGGDVLDGTHVYDSLEGGRSRNHAWRDALADKAKLDMCMMSCSMTPF